MAYSNDTKELSSGCVASQAHDEKLPFPASAFATFPGFF
jgi:hypothetical protein